MKQTKTKFYFLAPTREIDPDGLIKLGNIILSPSTPDEPLNKAEMVISEDLIKTRTIPKYDLVLEKKRDGKLGIMLSFLSMILGVGADASGNLADSDTEHWKCDSLKTFSFEPTPEYIAEALKNSEVKNFVQHDKHWLKTTKLYMITGVKVIYGGKGTLSYAQSKGIKLHVGLNAANMGVPIEVGPHMAGSITQSVKTKGGKTEPFVIAFRMHRIKISKKGETEIKKLSGGMLGKIDDEIQVDGFSEFTVDGLEEDDANAADFGIENDVEVVDLIESNGSEENFEVELVGCANPE